MSYLNLRNQKIDLLRGIAIFLVLILHFHLSYHLDQSIFNKFFTSTFISNFASNGNYGVTIFFVISGFLITLISIQRYEQLGTINLISFYVYRFARIMPCLILALVIIVFFNFTPLKIFKNDPHTTSLFVAVLSVLTFWHNFLMEKVGYFNYCLNIYWSLSIEEVFYLAFPLIGVLFKKLRFIIFFWAALIIIAPISRSFHSHDEIVALYGYFSCFDAIAIGCCAAVFTNTFKLKNKLLMDVIKYLAILSAIIIYCYKNIMDNVVFGVSLMELCAAVFLVIIVQEEDVSKNSKNIIVRTICWFGRNSYELYLFHIIILALMKEIYPANMLGNVSKIIWFLLFLLASVIVSEIIAKFYSQVLNIKLRKLLLRDHKNAIPNTKVHV